MSNNSPDFLGLPYELRSIIYDYAGCGGPTEREEVDGSTFTKLLLTDSRIREDLASVRFGLAQTVTFDSLWDVECFFELASERTIQSLGSLRLTRSWKPVNQWLDYELDWLLQLPGLNALHLDVDCVLLSKAAQKQIRRVVDAFLRAGSSLSACDQIEKLKIVDCELQKQKVDVGQGVEAILACIMSRQLERMLERTNRSLKIQVQSSRIWARQSDK